MDGDTGLTGESATVMMDERVGSITSPVPRSALDDSHVNPMNIVSDLDYVPYIPSAGPRILNVGHMRGAGSGIMTRTDVSEDGMGVFGDVGPMGEPDIA